MNICKEHYTEWKCNVFFFSFYIFFCKNVIDFYSTFEFVYDCFLSSRINMTYITKNGMRLLFKHVSYVYCINIIMIVLYRILM